MFLTKIPSVCKFILWFGGFSSCEHQTAFSISKFIIYLDVYLSPCYKNLLNLNIILSLNANKIINLYFCFQPSLYLSTPSSPSKPNTTAFVTPLEIKTKSEADDGGRNSLDELKAEVIELLCIVEALKKDHG